jgi:hypothetical protein
MKPTFSAGEKFCLGSRYINELDIDSACGTDCIVIILWKGVVG